LRDLILEQTRINDNIVKKLISNDKILEDINTKLDDFSSAMKDQLNHNKKVESKLAQLAAALPFATNPEQRSMLLPLEVANPLEIPHIQKVRRGDRQHRCYQQY
jgi:hypothetical protein